MKVWKATSGTLLLLFAFPGRSVKRRTGGRVLLQRVPLSQPVPEMYSQILLCTRSRLVPAVLHVRVSVPCTEEPVGGCRRSVKGQKWLSTSKYVCVCEKKDDEPLPSAASTAEKEEKVEQAAPGKAKENLLNLIAAMKVDISSKKRFQALKVQKMKELDKKVANTESTSSMFQKVTEDNERKRDMQLSPELVAAASAVATSLPFNKTQIESELLRQLKRHEEEAAQRRGDSHNISNIIVDMKIGKRPPGHSASRAANQIRFDDDGRGYTLERGVTHEYAGIRKRELYTRKRLNIFPKSYTDAVEIPEADSSPTLWDLELAKQISAAGHQPPRNGFEEMIQWTKEGKLWEFPINNEAGLEEEQNVEFHEHVFLDKHLENFPKQGPIRHFMELVICGLSKNPYLTVKQKTEHIEWFQNYFQGKEDLLKECDVFLN
ncbi:small ribosomal subunit protein mS31 [Microcaecilia unicolor]|uniref:Small ribosomal subunit protein mS31 n=1 Tax=Microcaecilia unicolor TaxID=1415580 RepID=A0A6P7XXS6_9AMPH|nr:28S ribosomal protein S31, mitochondrial [Microcaecilia unicolor]